MRFKDIVLLLALGGLASCGYTMRRSELSLGGKASNGGPEKIFIPVVDNATVRTGFEAELTTQLRETLALEHGIEIVNRPEDARYFLLSNVTDYVREKGPTPVIGTAGTEASGGLLNGASTAGDIRIRLGLTMKLVEKVNGDTQRLLWVHEFGTTTNFASSRRFVATGLGSDAGSSSAPYINESREKVQFQGLAKQIARQVVDQVVQDF